MNQELETGDGGRSEVAGGPWRLCDAAANRAAEAIRVLEDVARFVLDDAALTAAAKTLRHDLAAVLAAVAARHGGGFHVRGVRAVFRLGDPERKTAPACGKVVHPLGLLRIRAVIPHQQRADAVADDGVFVLQVVVQAQPLGREIAGDAVNAHAIGPVGRHRHLDHRIGAVIIGKTRPHRRVGGQFDDTIVVIAQFELAGRAHHAVALDPADRALPQHHAVGRNHRAGQAKHALHPGPRIGRAADDLQRLAVTGINREHLQLVGIGVARRGEHVRDAETGELVSRIFHALDLEADGIQRIADLRDVGGGLEVILEPGQRELHALAPTPAERVG